MSTEEHTLKTQIELDLSNSIRNSEGSLAFAPLNTHQVSYINEPIDEHITNTTAAEKYKHINADVQIGSTVATNSTLELPEPEELQSLVNLSTTQGELDVIKKNLDVILDAFTKNESMVTRAADTWGELPLWQQVAGGVILVVPTLATGLALNIGVLLTAGTASGITYAAAGAVLSDHHQCNIRTIQSLKDGVNNLADLLSIVILKLDKIRDDFSKEINKFKEENAKLKQHVGTLNNRISELDFQINSLSMQVEAIAELELLLRKSKEELESTAVKLEQAQLVQSEQFQQNQQELDTVTKAYQQSQIQLSDKIAELNQVKISMSLEVEKTRQIANTLQDTVATLAGTVTKDANVRKQLNEKLSFFANNKEASLLEISGRISEQEQKLNNALKELDERNKGYKELTEIQQKLLEKHTLLIARLEQVQNQDGKQKEPVLIGSASEHTFFKQIEQDKTIPADQVEELVLV